MDLTEPHRGNRWLTTDLGVYNAWDAYATSVAEPAVRALLRESGNEAYFERWFTRFVPVVMAMQRRGFGHLDREARFTYVRKLRKEMREVEREFMALVGRFARLRDDLEAECETRAKATTAEHFKRCEAAVAWAAESPRRSPDSRRAKADEWVQKQFERDSAWRKRSLRDIRDRERKFFNMSKDLKEVVFDEWGIKPAPVTKLRTARSLGQDSLLYILNHLRVRDQQYVPALHALCHRARLRTIWQRYLDLWVDTDDRVYPTIQCASARTMRLAYGSPALQQWPDVIRHLIKPAPGMCYVSADYSQIEARIAVIESGDVFDLELFEKFDAAEHGHTDAVEGCTGCEDRARYDVHSASARDRGGFTFEQWMALTPKLRKLHRFDAKRFRYKLQYGGSDQTEIPNTFCPCPRCVDKVPQFLAQDQHARLAAGQRWLAKHSAVTRWHDELCSTVQRDSSRLVSRFGYTRKFHEPWPQVRTQVVNFPCQHGAAEVINRAMVVLHEEHAAPLVLQMHDNLILECPLADAPRWGATLKAVMEAPVPEYATPHQPNGYRFPVDLKITGHEGRPNNWSAA